MFSLPYIAKAGQWEESKHPRADDGKFGEGGGESAEQSKPARKKLSKKEAANAVKKARNMQRYYERGSENWQSYQDIIDHYSGQSSLVNQPSKTSYATISLDQISDFVADVDETGIRPLKPGNEPAAVVVETDERGTVIDIIDGFHRTVGYIKWARENNVSLSNLKIRVVASNDKELISGAAEPGQNQQRSLDELYRHAQMKSFRLPFIAKAVPFDESKHKRAGGKFSSSGSPSSGGEPGMVASPPPKPKFTLQHIVRLGRAANSPALKRRMEQPENYPDEDWTGDPDSNPYDPQEATPEAAADKIREALTLLQEMGQPGKPQGKPQEIGNRVDVR